MQKPGFHWSQIRAQLLNLGSGLTESVCISVMITMNLLVRSSLRGKPVTKNMVHKIYKHKSIISIQIK